MNAFLISDLSRASMKLLEIIVILASDLLEVSFVVALDRK